MSLRKALAALPDDRESASATHRIITYFAENQGKELPASRIERATGVSAVLLGTILGILATRAVIDCAGDSTDPTCMYEPSSVLALEVQRYLRTGTGSDARLQQAAQRFRATQSFRP